MAHRPGIDVIVPVYRGLQQTRACIDSVLTSGLGAANRLVIIDDASPDPGVVQYVASLSGRDRVITFANDSNLGFVGTVNRGMALDPTRDVVLLNSDTMVANDWLARLQTCAYAQDRVATVTPFSNAGTICSYPFDGWSGGTPGTLGLTELDRLFARTLAGEHCELPTAVGFCMYIRRKALDETGPFDEARFGRGYGEENDFCRRASELGWTHLLAADTFVFHEGSVSFGDERATLQRVAHERLLEQHPDYLDQVRAFIERDPAASFRDRIDWARRAIGAREEACVLREHGDLPEDFSWPGGADSDIDTRPVRLHIAHGWGGGIQRWLDDFHAADATHRNLVLHSVSHRNAAGFRLELREPGVKTPLASYELQVPIRACAIDHPEYRARLAQTIAQTGASAVVVSSLIGHALDALDTGLPTAWVLHDLFPFCPALFGQFQRSCTRCEQTELTACLATNPMNVFWHNTTPADWLAVRARLASHVREGGLQIVAPSRSVVERWTRLLPALRAEDCTVVPHGIDTALLRPLPSHSPRGSGKLRLVVPGRLAPHKGLDILIEAVSAITRHADLLLLGCGDFGVCFDGLPGVRQVRDYAPGELAAQVQEFDPDAALLLSTVPESFSYTLSEMFALGLPVIATRVGAFADRIEAGRTGLLIDASPASLIDCVASLRHDTLAEMRRAVEALAVTDRCDSVAAIARQLPQGQALAGNVRMPAPDSAHRLQQLERDRRLRTCVRLGAAVHHERGTVALRDAEIAGLRRQLALAQGHPDPSPVGIAAHPRLEALRADRAEIRARVHFWLGLPERARLCLHPGDPEDDEAAERLLTAAMHLTRPRNDTVVVVTRSSGQTACWSSHQATLARLRSTRRLHFVPRAPEDASWLLACELLLPTTAEAARRFASMADQAGMACWDLSDSDAFGQERIAHILGLFDQLPPAPRGLNL